MKNKFKNFIIVTIISLISSIALSEELFYFNVAEIEITQDGNLFKGYGGGEAFSNDGVRIKAKSFEYNKTITTLIATDNVEFSDEINKIEIKAKKISYNKSKEKIIAEGNVSLKDDRKNIIVKAERISYLKNQKKIFSQGDVKVFDKSQNVEIEANKITYSKLDEKINATQDVIFKDEIRNIIIKSEEILFLKEEGKILTKGNTEANINSKYKFISKNVTFVKNEMKLSSNEKTVIEDNKNSLFELESFDYQINEEFLKAVDLKLTENTHLSPENQNVLYFANGFFDLKNQKFKTGPAKITLKKKPIW